MEIKFDDSELGMELIETNCHKENHDHPKINLQPEVQNNNGELVEKDQDVNYIIMSDPDGVICIDRRLNDFTSTVIPEVDNRKALMPPSILAIPPPLPPKRHQRLPAFEKTLNQNPQVKTFNKEYKPLNLLACQMSPVLSGVKGNNTCLGLVPEDAPDMHNYAYGTLPKVEQKCPPQLIPRSPPIPPIKPPRPNKPQRAETEEGNQRRKQEEEWRRHTGEIEDQRNREEQDLSERNEKVKENEETSGIESHLDVGIPPRQILNLHTDKKKGGEEGEDRGREESSNIGLTTMTENSSLLLMECSDLIPDEEPDMAANNRNCTSTETLKWTEKNKEIQMSGESGQDSGVISKLPSGHREGTEVVGIKLDACQLGLQRLEDTQETAERLVIGELKLTSQSTKARQKVKKIAKKVMVRLKEKREEKRRIKVEMEMNRVRDNHIVTHEVEWEEEEEENEEEEEIDEDTVDHAELVEKIVKRNNATSDSPFGSFKVCNPVKLVEELLSGKEWSQFLYRDQSSIPEPPPYQTHSEDTAQLSLNSQFYSSAELDLALNVFEGKPAVPEEEPVYEDISPSNIITGKSQTHEQQEMNRTPITAVPKILLESETSQMSMYNQRGWCVYCWKMDCPLITAGCDICFKGQHFNVWIEAV